MDWFSWQSFGGVVLFIVLAVVYNREIKRLQDDHQKYRERVEANWEKTQNEYSRKVERLRVKLDAYREAAKISTQSLNDYIERAAHEAAKVSDITPRPPLYSAEAFVYLLERVRDNDIENFKVAELAKPWDED